MVGSNILKKNLSDAVQTKLITRDFLERNNTLAPYQGSRPNRIIVSVNFAVASERVFQCA